MRNALDRGIGRTARRLAMWLLVGWSLAACGDIFGSSSGSSGRTNRGIGEDCSSAADCRSGLVCTQRVCSPAGNRPQGTTCTLTGDCAENLYCQAVVTPDGSVGGVCAPSGQADVDGACETSADCQRGLYCHIFGFGGTCQQSGTGDLGTACTHPGDSSDCLAGLTCTAQQMCAQSPIPAGVVLFDGGTCPDPGIADGDTFHSIFEVPRTGQAASSDFYGLPFPNDIRVHDGHIDLSGHPRPDLDTVGNVVKNVIDAVEADVTGFGPDEVVFFRFNAFPNPDTIVVGGDHPALSLVNVDSASPDFGRRLSLSWSATDGRGKFICNNWLGVRPFWSQPFATNTTYAAYLTTDIRSADGDTPTQPADLTAVLGATQPSDPDLAAAWQAYAPFRAYLDAQSISPDTIANAAVFTVGDPTAHLPGIRQAVAALGTPDHGDMVLCDDGVTSPCDDGLTGDAHTEGCFTAQDSFYEIHTTVDIPIFQEGTEPYLESGGELVYDENGLPIQQRTEAVCVAITIPRNLDMPESGWPVVVHAHGTGGNFRTIADSYGADLAAIGYASIGYEGIDHGRRRGDSQLDPDILFFNFANPRGVLGSILQGAVDVMAMGRFAAGFQATAGESPTGAAIDFDDTKVVFFGHSQGSIVGPPALAVDDVYSAAVLSGVGGGLILSLLAKTSPLDIADGIKAILDDGGLSDFHPFLNLVQLYFEPVDTLNYGAGILGSRPEGMAPLPVFVTYGVGDTYAPNSTTQQLAHRMSLPVLGPPVLDDFGRPTVTPPVTNNLTVGETSVTAALGEYRPPEGRDGHFVIFDVDTARAQFLGFLQSFAATGSATIPAP